MTIAEILSMFELKSRSQHKKKRAKKWYFIWVANTQKTETQSEVFILTARNRNTEKHKLKARF